MKKNEWDLHIRDYEDLRKDFDSHQKSINSWIKWGLQLVLGAVIVALLALVIKQ